MLPLDKRVAVICGDRCPAARFSCDVDDRAEPPFRLALRHGSHAGSLTLGKGCENPVGRSDRPSGDSAGIAHPDLSRFTGAGIRAALTRTLVRRLAGLGRNTPPR